MKNTKMLVLIVVVAVFFRLVRLGDLGMGFFRDEAALGYNSWSISQTFKDEYGRFMPVVFRSFEVFFLPLYVYLSALMMRAMGFSVYTTRLVAALSGVGLVVVTYCLSRLIFKSYKYLAEIIAFMVAVSPWTLFYSRGAFEGNLALFLFSAGVGLFYLWLENTKQTRWLTWSLLTMVLSMYSYQAERLVVPLWLAAAWWMNRDGWRGTALIRWRVFLPAFILAVPLIFIWFSPAGLHRAVGVSLINSGGVPLLEPGQPSGLLINNKVYLVIKKILAMYVSYFSPRNLFWELDYDPQRGLVGQPVLFFWLIPGYFYGWWLAFKDWLGGDVNFRLLMVWLLLSPLPAALTTDPFHTYRSLLMSVPVIILASRGSYELFVKLHGAKKIVAMIGLMIGFIFSTSRMISSYLVVTPAFRGNEWDYVFKPTVKAIEKIKDDKKKIVFDTSYSEPYIQYLFWTKYDPYKYQRASGALELDYYGSVDRIRVGNVGNVYFEEVDWPSRRGDSGTVFVMPNSKVPVSEFAGDPKIKLIKEINDRRGKIFFRFLEIKI